MTRLEVKSVLGEVRRSDLMFIYFLLLASGMSTEADDRCPLPYPMENKRVLFINSAPCSLAKDKHGWVAELPKTMMRLHTGLRVYARNDSDVDGSITEITRDGACRSTTINMKSSFGITIERTSLRWQIYAPRNVSSEHYAIIDVLGVNRVRYSCNRCFEDDDSRWLASDSFIKVPSFHRVKTIAKIYDQKEHLSQRRHLDRPLLNLLSLKGSRKRDDGGIRKWSERENWLDERLGIIYFPHTFREKDMKGHILFAKGIRKRNYLFQNYTFHFSGGVLKTKTLRDIWMTTKSYLDDGNISYSRVQYDEKYSYEEHLCHANGKILVTLSKKDANPRIPYDGLFCNLPHFSSYETKLHKDLELVGYFTRLNDFDALDLYRTTMREWGERPRLFALQNLTYEKMMCGILHSYSSVNGCCPMDVYIGGNPVLADDDFPSTT